MSTWPGSDPTGDQRTPPKRAAQYVRMSTEHQQYSPKNQEAAMRAYAEARNLVLVRTYADEGKSGLKVEGRNALKGLISDVETGNADFQAILVYDVSRWGRFQDADGGRIAPDRRVHSELAPVLLVDLADDLERDPDRLHHPRHVALKDPAGRVHDFPQSGWARYPPTRSTLRRLWACALET